MGAWGIGHWLIVLVVVLLVFGTRRLRGAGRDLGEALRGFKQGLHGGEETPPAQLDDASRSNQNDGQTGGGHGNDAAPR